MKKSYVVLLMIVFILSSCTSGPIDRDAETKPSIDQDHTATPRPTRMPTATPYSCDDEIAINNDWTTVYCDNFEDNRNNWADEDTDNLATSMYVIEDGMLVVDFTGKVNQGYQSGVIQWTNIANVREFTVSIRGEIISNFDNVTWGINFLGDDDKFYSFMLSNVGTYWLQMLDNDGWKDLIPIKSHSALNWDDVNELTIEVSGDQFNFYINGTLVDSYSASALSGDELSLAIWAAEGVAARLEFDDLVVKVP